MKKLLILIGLCLAGALPSSAAIARDGSCTAANTSCTFSATATGDLKIIFAMASGLTAPTLPTGWTSIATLGTTGSSGSTNITTIIGCNVSSSSADTGSGTWTSATNVVGMSYSGTPVGTTANCNLTGTHVLSSNQAKASTTINYQGGFTFVGANSWVVGFAGDHSVATCNPATLTNVTTSGTGPEATANDSNAAVASYSSGTCTVASSAWVSFVVEILNQNCSNTVFSGFTCVKNGTAFAASGSLTVTFPSGYAASQTIVIQGYQNAATAYTSGMLTNTAGYSWTFFGACQSASAARSMGVWYFNVASTNSSSDTITLNSSYSGSFEALDVAVYSGVGAIDGAGVVCAKGTTGSPASGNYTVTVGDLLIGAAQASAGPLNVGSGWTNRVQDSATGGSAFLTMIEDSVAASTTANASFSNTDTDWVVQALAFLVPSTGGIACHRALMGVGC